MPRYNKRRYSGTKARGKRRTYKSRSVRRPSLKQKAGFRL